MNQLLKDKEAFFAQYWGQKVLSMPKGTLGQAVTVNPDMVANMEDSSWINLKSIQNLTDEDAIEVAKIHDKKFEYRVNNNVVEITDYKVIRHYSTQVERYAGKRYMGCDPLATFADGYNLEQIDFIRSKGYLLPFRNYTVEQIIDMGWAKIEDVCSDEYEVFSCKGCGHELPINYEDQTPGYCYLCEERINSEEHLGRSD